MARRNGVRRLHSTSGACRPGAGRFGDGLGPGAVRSTDVDTIVLGAAPETFSVSRDRSGYPPWSGVVDRPEPGTGRSPDVCARANRGVSPVRVGQQIRA